MKKAASWAGSILTGIALILLAGCEQPPTCVQYETRPKTEIEYYHDVQRNRFWADNLGAALTSTTVKECVRWAQ